MEELVSTRSYNASRTSRLNWTVPLRQQNDLANTTHMVIIPLYGTIFLVGALVNLTILAVIASMKKLRNSTNLFIANLAVSDLLMNVAIVITPLYAIKNNWLWGLALCKIFITVGAVGILISSFTLAAIAVYRYTAICGWGRSGGQRYRLKVRYAALTCAAIWLFAVGICVPLSLNVRTVARSKRQTMCREMWSNETHRNVFTGFLMALQFAVPVSLMAFCHVRIHIFLKRQLQNESLRSRTVTVSRKLATLRRREKIHRVLFAMVVVYAVCWLPMHVFNLVWEVAKELFLEWTYTMQLYYAVNILAMLSTVLDPLLYAILNRQIRTSIYNAFKRVVNHRSTSPRSRTERSVVRSNLETNRCDLTQMEERDC